MQTFPLGLSVPRSLILCHVCLWVSMCSRLLQEEASMIMAEQGTDLRHFIATFLVLLWF